MRNKKIILIIIAVLVVVVGAIIGFMVWQNFKDNDGINDGRNNNQLKTNAILINQKYTDKKITNATSAVDSLKDVVDVLGISNLDKEIKFFRETTDSYGDTYYYLEQIYEGVPVYGKDITVIADKNGNAVGLSSNYKPLKFLSTIPKISKSDAESKAKDYIAKEYKFDIDKTQINSCDIIIYYENEAVLAYEIYIGYGHFWSASVIIDSEKGNCLYINETLESGSQQEGKFMGQERERVINFNLSDNQYYMIDESKNITIYQAINTIKYLNNKNYLVCDWDCDDIVWNKNETPPPSAVDAMANVSEAYNFFHNKMNFIDGNIDTAKIDVLVGVKYLHKEEQVYDSYVNNAKGGYDPIQHSFILILGDVGYAEDDDSGSKFSDRIGHEYGHGVIQYLKNSKNLSNASLVEAYCDIFGECVEDNTEGYAVDWKIFSRDIKNPSNSNNPVHYKDYDYESTDEHKNSTIISHVAYLMWNGGEDTGELTRIDQTAVLAKIWYKSLLTIKFDATFSDCRNAIIFSAGRLYKNGEITAEQLETVSKAFEAVGLGGTVTSHFYRAVKNEFILTVYDLIGENHNNYHLKIEDTLSNMRYSKGIVFDEDINSDKKSLKIEDGIYVMTITNLNDASQQQSIIINVQDYKLLSTDKVDIYTNFIPISEATKHSLDSQGTEVTLPVSKSNQMKKMLNSFMIAQYSSKDKKIVKYKFEPNENVPEDILFSSLFETLLGGQELDKATAEKIMLEFWGRSFKDIENSRGKDVLHIDFIDGKFVMDGYGLEYWHETNIQQSYDLGNGYYKVTGKTTYIYQEMGDDTPKTILDECNMIAIFKENENSRLGFNLMALEYKENELPEKENDTNTSEVSDIKNYAGEYRGTGDYDRAGLTITQKGDHLYFLVHWSSSWKDGAEWTMDGVASKADNKVIVSYTNLKNIEYEYPNNSNERKDSVVYDNRRGEIQLLPNSKIYWDNTIDDYKITFEKLIN